ncbi:hypothetical protein tb265_41230 [Gemmatimonadetes bacterium T265]|nr:hypothetical protein tb265_41230 [Gemmatimonadetes bacterium T265]
MKTAVPAAAAVLLCAAGWAADAPHAVRQPAVTPPATDARTRAMAAATTAFLHSLGDDQRARVQFPFERPAKAVAVRIPHGPGGRFAFEGEQYGRAVWSNYPVSDVPRPGLRLGTLTAPQRAAALHVLQAVLSPMGYQKVRDIMDADQKLSESGTPYDDGVDVYTMAVFGAPSDTAPWMLQFGGHHLGINVVVAGPNVSFTPTLTGTQPAAFTRDGRTVRPLGRETDLAFRLVGTLSAAQRRKAVLNYAVEDLVLGPGHDGEALPPEGLSAAELTAAQRALLMELVGEWVGMLNADDAAPKLARIRADLERTYFAWYGATTAPGPIYFRVTGPTLHVEFANQQWGRGPGGGGPPSGGPPTGGAPPGGGPPQATGVQAGGANHVHTVYRDPTNAYGRGLAAK